MHSPIVLFTYNRPLHTKQTLDALAINSVAGQSELYIYCDGVKPSSDDENLHKINAVREIVYKENRFKKVHVIVQQKNKGLANSIIDGVTEVINNFGKIIVLEDDIIVGEYFLNYMNKALALFENSEQVKQVSGFAFNLQIPLKQTAYLIPLTTTWGWATWQRAWKEIDFNPKDYEVLKNDSRLKSQFNIDNSYDYTSMLFEQMERKTIDSWGIRYWWSVFKNKGLVLHPDYSLVKNIGFDKSGVHCSDDSFVESSNWNNRYKVENYPGQFVLNKSYFNSTKQFLQITNFPKKPSLKSYIKIRVKKLLSFIK